MNKLIRERDLPEELDETMSELIRECHRCASNDLYRVDFLRPLAGVTCIDCIRGMCSADTH